MSTVSDDDRNRLQPGSDTNQEKQGFPARTCFYSSFHEQLDNRADWVRDAAGMGVTFHPRKASTEREPATNSEGFPLYKIGSVLLTMITLWPALRSLASSPTTPAEVSRAVPVLVELFTSEGCSSCPPADALLEKLDTQPFPGGQMIVLSEHVDYWNHIGWTDPYSSHALSERQSAYGRRFGLESVYTPQMIVDGSQEFVGSDPSAARRAFDKAVSIDKVPLRISNATVVGNTLHAHVEAKAPASPPRTVDAVLAVALDHAESQVKGGENAGHRLTHVAVVRSLTKIGKLTPGQPLSQDVSVALDPGSARSDLRVIVFLQEHGQSHILGAAEIRLPKK